MDLLLFTTRTIYQHTGGILGECLRRWFGLFTYKLLSYKDRTTLVFTSFQCPWKIDAAPF